MHLHHVIHYTTKYNVSVKSVWRLTKLCVYYFAAICQANSDKGGATVDTQFRDSLMSVR